MPTIFLLCAVVAGGTLLTPYPATTFMAICLAILTLPTFEKLQNRFGNKKAITIYSLAMLLCIATPVAVVALMVAPQAINGVRLFTQWRETGWEIPPEIQHYLDMIEEWLIDIPEVTQFIQEINNNIAELVNTIAGYLLSGVAGFAGSLVNVFWLLFLFITLTLLCLVYAKQIKILAENTIDFQKGMLDRFIKTIRAALASVVMGILFVSLLQGVVCTIGFIIFQVPEPLFWGLLACLVSPIPFIGTAMVWAPLSFVLWFIASPWMAIGLVLWGTLIVGLVDNFARPYYLSKGIKAPFFVLLLSILCALAVFGPLGLIAGPVLIALALQCIYEAERLIGLENLNDLSSDDPYSRKIRKSRLLQALSKKNHKMNQHIEDQQINND